MERAHEPPSWLASLVLVPVSWLYGLGARIHRTFMRLTSRTRSRPDCAIVSVGAITVGGAGKTPLAARLAAGLRARGYRVVLASRGYKGRRREPVTVVSDGSHIHAYASEAGDESLVLAAHAPGVPVLVGRDRNVVGQHAVSHFGAEILVLDDGFQHHRLARDLDVVSLDGVAGLGNARVLPAGPLREPRSSLRFASWICIVDGDGTPPPGAARWLAKLARVEAIRVPRAAPSERALLPRRQRAASARRARRGSGSVCCAASRARARSVVRSKPSAPRSSASAAFPITTPSPHATCTDSIPPPSSGSRPRRTRSRSCPPGPAERRSGSCRSSSRSRTRRRS